MCKRLNNRTQIFSKRRGKQKQLTHSPEKCKTSNRRLPKRQNLTFKRLHISLLVQSNLVYKYLFIMLMVSNSWQCRSNLFRHIIFKLFRLYKKIYISTFLRYIIPRIYVKINCQDTKCR